MYVHCYYDRDLNFIQHYKKYTNIHTARSQSLKKMSKISIFKLFSIQINK